MTGKIHKALDLKLKNFVVSSFVAIGCATEQVSIPPSSSQPVEPAGLPVEPFNTEIPKDFSRIDTVSTRKLAIAIPESMLATARIVRPQAELRSGPGSHFDLLDSTLELNDKVVIFDTIGVWNKIISLRLGISGWLHFKTLAPVSPEAGAGSVEMSVKMLPRVIAVEPVDHVYSHDAMIRIPVAIKRGTQFIALRKAAGRTLVWIPKTNSVLWLSQDIVK